MKSINKKLILLLLILAIISPNLLTDVFADSSISTYTPTDIAQSTVLQSEEYHAVPFADIIGWRYKSVDGKMYRRLYNYSKQKWMGNWELC